MEDADSVLSRHKRGVNYDRDAPVELHGLYILKQKKNFKNLKN